MYSVEISKTAEKSFQKLSAKDQDRVIDALENLKKDPHMGKRLQGPLKGLWSLRVWPLRIIYCINDKIVTVFVVSIGHRKDIYKKLQ